MNAAGGGSRRSRPLGMKEFWFERTETPDTQEGAFNIDSKAVSGRARRKLAQRRRAGGRRWEQRRHRRALLACEAGVIERRLAGTVRPNQEGPLLGPP